MLKWTLIVLCILKIVSYSLRTKSNQVKNEVEQFYREELARKWNEHSIARGFISAITEEYDRDLRDSVRRYLGSTEKDKGPEFIRTRFQDYSRYLCSIDSSWISPEAIDLAKYPRLLQNTVAEENAKQEIYLHLKHLNSLRKDSGNNTLKGIIVGIHSINDSLTLNILPFGYERRLKFDYCQCGRNRLPIETNPFIYSGSIYNCKYVYTHTVTKEIVKNDLDFIQ